VETAQLKQDGISRLTQLWTDGAAPTEADLRAARSVAAKLADFEGLKPFPAVVQRLVEHVSTPDFKMDRVRELIESDPALAARIMRVANSAAYRAYEACTSIGRAVMRIGTTGVVNLAMGMAAMGMFEDLGGVGRKVRDHSAGTAAVARELAFRLAPSNVSSTLFLAGLLHDIGKLLMIQSKDPEYLDLVSKEPSANAWHVHEQERLGFDHGQLGGHVLRVWNLPHPIPQIVAAHHQPKTVQAKTAVTKAVDLLRAADDIEQLLDQGAMAESPHLSQLVNSPNGIRAGLTEDKLFEIWDDLVLVRSEAISLFQR
jgi:putative nucleotidyltransferase with HDIG domain